MARTESEAIELARAYLASRITLRPVSGEGVQFYGVDLGNSFIFAVERCDAMGMRVGSDEYIAVSRECGEIIAHGFSGD